MSNIPNELFYTTAHEWIRKEDDGSVTVGITDHAQELLGELVFVELPEVGAEYSGDEEIAVVESVKAASDVYCPISGEVMAVNSKLLNSPELVNANPYDQGWLFQLQPLDQDDLKQLLDAKAYQAQIDSEAN